SGSSFYSRIRLHVIICGTFYLTPRFEPTEYVFEDIYLPALGLGEMTALVQEVTNVEDMDLDLKVLTRDLCGIPRLVETVRDNYESTVGIYTIAERILGHITITQIVDSLSEYPARTIVS